MSNEIIDKIVDMIVPLVKPDKIILFGSYATGKNTEHSEVYESLQRMDRQCKE